MDIKKVLTIIIILLFSNSVFAQIEITPIDSIEIDPNDPEAEQLYNQRILSRIAVLEQKVNQTVTKDEYGAGTNFIVQTLADFVEDSNTNMILALILINLFVDGLVFGIYLYLVSQRRLAGRKVIQKEGTEWLTKK